MFVSGPSDPLLWPWMVLVKGFSISRTESISRNKTIYTAFCPLILRVNLSHNAIENKVYYDLAITLYYVFQIRKENELIGQKS